MSIKSLTKDCYLTTDQLHCGGGQDYYVARAERYRVSKKRLQEQKIGWQLITCNNKIKRKCLGYLHKRTFFKSWQINEHIFIWTPYTNQLLNHPCHQIGCYLLLKEQLILQHIIYHPTQIALLTLSHLGFWNPCLLIFRASWDQC